jgi:hypothetical protein
MTFTSAGDTSESFGRTACAQSRSNRLLLDVAIRSVNVLAPLAALAKVVIDSLRNQVANPTVFLGTNPLNERQFVGKKKDRGAD